MYNLEIFTSSFLNFILHCFWLFQRLDKYHQTPNIIIILLYYYFSCEDLNGDKMETFACEIDPSNLTN